MSLRSERAYKELINRLFVSIRELNVLPNTDTARYLSNAVGCLNRLSACDIAIPELDIHTKNIELVWYTSSGVWAMTITDDIVTDYPVNGGGTVVSDIIDDHIIPDDLLYFIKNYM